MDFVFSPPPQASLPIVGNAQRFPIHRIYCVARNYVDHAQEMGDTGREPPFSLPSRPMPPSAPRRVSRWTCPTPA